MSGPEWISARDLTWCGVGVVIGWNLFSLVVAATGRIHERRRARAWHVQKVRRRLLGDDESVAGAPDDTSYERSIP